MLLTHLAPPHDISLFLLIAFSQLSWPNADNVQYFILVGFLSHYH